MKFTFGICTTLGSEQKIKEIISSIERNNILPSNCEIIIIGNVLKPCFSKINIQIFPFDESKKTGWITKKKNIIAQKAKFENIVYMHDYIILEDDWYKTMCDYGNNWNLLMTRINNYDGSRYRDWILCGDWKCNPFIKPNTANGLLPYTEKRLSKWMYFSGAYWLAKKQFMLDYPLDESLCWGEGEDVEWSYRVKAITDFSLNENTEVRINKSGKERYFTDCDSEYLNKTYDRLTRADRELPLQVELNPRKNL